MSAPVRFWGRVLSIHPRLIVTKFEDQTEASCPGYILTLDGTLTRGMEPAVGATFTVAIGPAVMLNREPAVGDLLRGEAYPVPEHLPDMPAEFYKVGVFRIIARAETPPSADPPRTDPPPAADAIPQRTRRALLPALLADDGPCASCSYGVMACVVRLTDPRHYRDGKWTQVPACLGPDDCPHFQPRE